MSSIKNQASLIEVVIFTTELDESFSHAQRSLICNLSLVQDFPDPRQKLVNFRKHRKP